MELDPQIHRERLINASYHYQTEHKPRTIGVPGQRDVLAEALVDALATNDDGIQRMALRTFLLNAELLNYPFNMGELRRILENDIKFD